MNLFLLEMFTLRTWLTNIKVQDIVKCNLDSVTKSKKLCEFNNLKYHVNKELVEKYAGWYIIYTDGSKSDKGRGASFYVATKKDCNLYDNDCLKIDGEVCIMTVELIAISEALSYVKTTNYKKVLICTDSKSALEHIARSASGIRGVSVAYAVLASMDELYNMGVNLKLQWVPSHIGLSGNEEADTLAKYGCKAGKNIKVHVNHYESLPKYKQLIYKEWKEYFDKKSLEKGIWYRTLQCEPLHIPWSSYTTMKRKYVVLAHRLRSGHIPTNKFCYLMGKTPSPNCDVCGVLDDVHHLLVECARYQLGRDKLVSDLNLNKFHVGVFRDLLTDPNSERTRNLLKILFDNN